MNTELKNCPFCGAEADVHIYGEDNKLIVKVGCTKCGISKTVRTNERQELNNFRWTIKEAVMDWNTRAKIVADLEIMSDAINYDVTQDLIMIQTSAGTIRMNRDWFVTQCKRFTEMYEESKMSEWLPTAEGYLCHNCNTESRYAHRTCPNCGQRMKNGIEMV